MFKFFFPLKWALAESLVKLAGISSTPNGADLYEKTRVTLLHICGQDPKSVPMSEVHSLTKEILELREMKEGYEAAIKSLERSFSDAREAYEKFKAETTHTQQ